MTNPSYVTAQNVKFDGTTSNAVVLSTAGGVRKLLLWDELSVSDQQIVNAFVVAHGGTAPASGVATSGHASLGYGAAVGSTSTGLNNGTPATAGRQDVGFTATAGATATGLANDATAYTATITIDGVAKPVSLVGSATQTFTTLISGLQTAIGAAGTVTAFSSTLLRFVSATTGTSSTVSIAPGTLFPAVAGYQTISGPGVTGTAAIPATTYTATITVDGVAKPVSFLGSTAQTFTTLVSQLTTAVGAAGTVALTSGSIVITSATTGATSTVAVANGNLFAAVAGYTSTVIVAGAAAVDLWNLFQTTRSPNGALYAEVFKVYLVGAKPVVQPHTPHNIHSVYFDGTQWLYLDDDTPVCAI